MVKPLLRGVDGPTGNSAFAEHAVSYNYTSQTEGVGGGGVLEGRCYDGSPPLHSVITGTVHPNS